MPANRTQHGSAQDLRQAYTMMRGHYGHLGWWPGDSPFEICVGAILTQNTSWKNVEKALTNLKLAGVLAPETLFKLPEPKLAALLRPAGYFNVKARRLRAFLETLNAGFNGDLNHLFSGSTETVRHRLLAINGIGPETADSMLLYAGNHHRFVIDAYTKRIFSRHEWCSGKATYDDLQRLCESALDREPSSDRLDYWQDYHAQLVMIGKDFCRPKNPKCQECPLRSILPKSGICNQPTEQHR